MLLPKDPKRRLRRAKQLYLETRDHRAEEVRRRREDFEFHAGRQWPEQAKQALQSDNRPALTFNLVAQVIRELVGAFEDTKRRMRAVPVGIEDRALSDAMDALWQRVYREKELASMESEVLEKALIGGISEAAVEVTPMAGKPDWWEIDFPALSPFESLWDANAEASDYSDAGHVFWAKWFTEAEFAAEFPDKAERFEKMKRMTDDMTFVSNTIDRDNGQYVVSNSRDLAEAVLTDPMELNAKDWFRMKENELLVVRMEFLQEEPQYYIEDLVPDENGEVPGFINVERETYEIVKRAGNIRTRRTFEPVIRWYEFTGIDVLYDDVSPIPIDRFTLHPLIACMDYQLKEPVGLVHPMKDPQQEVNKRYSYGLDLTLKQAQPGAVMEEGATPDIDEFNRATRTPGQVAILSQNALVEGRYQERPAPQAPVAADDLADRAFTMFSRVVGLPMDPLIGARAGDEAMGAALLRHRKSLQSISPILGHLRRFQRSLVRSIIEVIQRVLPDDQIQSMLGDSDRWIVQGGVIIDQRLQTQVAFRDLRETRWNVEMESAADDTTSQMLILQTLVQAQAAGLPVDPEVLAELMPLPRDQRARQIEFVRNTLESQARAQTAQLQLQQAQAATTAQQTQDVVDIEAARVRQRHEQATEKNAIDRSRVLLDFAAKIMSQQEGAEGANRDRNIELIKLIVDAAQDEQEQQERAPAPIGLPDAGQAR